MEHGLFRGAGIVNHDHHVRVSISQCGSLTRTGCGQTWVILEPINCGDDDGPTKLIIHVDRSIWVDIRKSKERLQLFNGTTAIEVDPVHLTVAFIRITPTVSDRSQDKTCLIERAERVFAGSSTSGNHAPSFYRLSYPHDTGTGGSFLESGPGQVLTSAEDGAGYDIKSYTLNGEEKFIEVKTTQGEKGTAFYLSSHETRFATDHADRFYLYRVFEFDHTTSAGKVFVHRGDLGRSFAVSPIQFKVSPAFD